MDIKQGIYPNEALPSKKLFILAIKNWWRTINLVYGVLLGSYAVFCVSNYLSPQRSLTQGFLTHYIFLRIALWLVGLFLFSLAIYRVHHGWLENKRHIKNSIRATLGQYPHIICFTILPGLLGYLFMFLMSLIRYIYKLILSTQTISFYVSKAILLMCGFVYLYVVVLILMGFFLINVEQLPFRAAINKSIRISNPQWMKPFWVYCLGVFLILSISFPALLHLTINKNEFQYALLMGISSIFWVPLIINFSLLTLNDLLIRYDNKTKKHGDH